MTRTYRRMNASYNDKRWECSELVRVARWHWVRVDYPVGSEKYKKSSARYHSDAGTYNYREPGPSWFRNITAERPHRRSAKKQLHKFIKDYEYEVLIMNKPKLEYWS